MAPYSSEFGRSGGGVFNIVTKSGTNDFHAVGYEFLQNNHEKLESAMAALLFIEIRHNCP